jgi:hypothetical protein
MCDALLCAFVHKQHKKSVTRQVTAPLRLSTLLQPSRSKLMLCKPPGTFIARCCRPQLLSGQLQL